MAEAMIDRAALERLLVTIGGDQAFLAEMIGVFFDDARQQCAAMRHAIAAQHADDLRRAAHSLKSNGANFGATILARLCFELEESAKRGIPNGAAEQVAQIEIEFEQVARALSGAGLIK